MLSVKSNRLIVGTIILTTGIGLGGGLILSAFIG
jgi:hypothetical protein